MKSGKNTYPAVSGTGKLKGIEATGTCTYSDGGEGGIEFSRTGNYTVAGAAPAAN